MKAALLTCSCCLLAVMSWSAQVACASDDVEGAGPVVRVAKASDSDRLEVIRTAFAPDAGAKRQFISAEPVNIRFENGRPKRKAVKHVYQVGDQREEIYHGPFEEYHPNGKKWKEGKYENGKREGEWQWWRADGQLAKKGAFVGDRSNGEWLYYYPDGAVRRRENWNSGKRQGKTVTFFEGGENQETEENWENGERQGVTQQWYPNGQMKAKYEFLANNVHGTVSEWHENGKKKSERGFRNGKLHGQAKEWDAEGEEITSHNYEDGERIE